MIADAAPHALLPAPLDFVLTALEASGALCERSEREDEAIAVLPPELAQRLDVPEECRLALYPEHEGDVSVGLGSPLLQAQLFGQSARRCWRSSWPKPAASRRQRRCGSISSRRASGT